jgi:NADPH2 dehydrogenase
MAPTMASYRKVAQYKSPDALADRLKELGIAIPIDQRVLSSAEGSPLAVPLKMGRLTAGNRWCIHPMEGWDAQHDGRPTEKTLRRWKRFGESGAKLIWGGEAAAVQPDGRANPNQTLATPENRDGLKALLGACRQAHLDQWGSIDDLIVGLQLTHSGRFCRPYGKSLEPRIAYHHPLLDAKYSLDPTDETLVWTDSDLQDLKSSYIRAAQLAQEVGFHFVDIKCCHGYLLHEFLSARSRPGAYGGHYEGRTRLLMEIIDGVAAACPDLELGVRLSFFDSIPYHRVDQHGEPMAYADLIPYQHGFGTRVDDPLQPDLTEPLRLIGDLFARGVAIINLSCGSPYYNPHMQRPAIFPPSDGYPPPEDPLLGVARQISLAQEVKRQFPDQPFVGTGYSYLQDYLPHVAQAVVREGWIDAVGLGRMVLSYPTLPGDCLEGNALKRKWVCRTFSDCTTGPRIGLPSGCYPLDNYYKKSREFSALQEYKSNHKSN